MSGLFKRKADCSRNTVTAKIPAPFSAPEMQEKACLPSTEDKSGQVLTSQTRGKNHVVLAWLRSCELLIQRSCPGGSSIPHHTQPPLTACQLQTPMGKDSCRQPWKGHGVTMFVSQKEKLKHGKISSPFSSVCPSQDPNPGSRSHDLCS